MSILKKGLTEDYRGPGFVVSGTLKYFVELEFFVIILAKFSERAPAIRLQNQLGSFVSRAPFGFPGSSARLSTVNCVRGASVSNLNTQEGVLLRIIAVQISSCLGPESS